MTPFKKCKGSDLMICTMNSPDVHVFGRVEIVSTYQDGLFMTDWDISCL